MNDAFYIAATGLEAQQRALDTAANNIANLNTLGYKRAQVRFSELLTPTTDGGAPSIDGVAVNGSARVFDQGEVRATGRAMDLAIDGPGFIELLGKDGSALLWRGGSLKVNPDGYLAASNGAVLAAMISVPADAGNLSISADGKVTAQIGTDQGATVLGQIDLVSPQDLSALKPAGEGFYQADHDGLAAAPPGEMGLGALRQGAVEASNVDLAQEMVGLLLTQRAYAANAQVLQAGDQLMSIANNLRR